MVFGDELRYCDEPGQWSGVLPICAAVYCSPLVFPGGTVMCDPPNNFDFRTVCRFHCPSGYTPDVPGLEMICQADKEWFGRMPSSCQPVDCDSYPSVENAEVFCDGTTFQKVCVVICNIGYKAEQSRAECLSSGKWSESLKCSRIICPRLDFTGQPGGMDCDSEEFGFPGTCSFTCNAGYSLQGRRNLNCQEDGTWDDLQPTCTDVFCPDLSLADGIIDCTYEFQYPSTCKFTCSHAFQLYGMKETRCLASGKWSNPLPKCKYLDPKCKNAIPPSTCEENCETNADCDNNEVCCQSSCGLTCKKIKVDPPKRRFDIDRNMLLLLLAASHRKPHPQPIQPACPVCNVNACSIARCPTYLNALCGTSCNGCRAHFFSPYNQRLDLTRQCQCPSTAPANPQCGGHMCYGVICANAPGAHCRVYGCGSRCYLQFFDRFGRRVPCSQLA